MRFAFFSLAILLSQCSHVAQSNSELNFRNSCGVDTVMAWRQPRAQRTMSMGVGGVVRLFSALRVASCFLAAGMGVSSGGVQAAVVGALVHQHVRVAGRRPLLG